MVSVCAYVLRMRKTVETPHAPRRAPRVGRWRPAKALPPVDRAVAVARVELRAAFGRDPTVDELAARAGLRERDVRARLDALAARGVPAVLSPRSLECLSTVDRLRAEFGRSPSTAEVSKAMALPRSGSRYHLAPLVELGLVTPPRAVVVLDVTATGRALLAAIPAPATRPAVRRARATPPESERA